MRFTKRSAASRSEAHSYPPSRPATMPEPSNAPSPEPSLHPISYNKRTFLSRLRQAARHPAPNNLSTSGSVSHTATEGAPQTPQTSTSDCTASASSRWRLLKQRADTTKPAPPIVVPSWRYKANVNTVVAREDHDYSVLITIVTPVPRFRFRLGWSHFLKKFTFRLPGRFRLFRRKSEAKSGKNRDAKGKGKYKEGGVKVEQDICSDTNTDAWSIINPPNDQQSQRNRNRNPKQESQTVQMQSQSQLQSSREEHRKTTRRWKRSVGTVGITSDASNRPTPELSAGTNSESDASASAGTNSRSASQSRPRTSNRTSLIIDGANNMILVPVPDIDIHYSRNIKHELQEVAHLDLDEMENTGIRLVQKNPGERNPDETFEVDAIGRDSAESWLDLE